MARQITAAHKKGEIDDPYATYERLLEILEPLYEQLKKWRRYLLTRYFEEHKQPGNDWYLKNDCGITFRKDPGLPSYKQRAQAAAWYLQGKEAAYIHELTLLGPEYDYEVIANEHDGLVTIGKIPEEAKAEAHERANFKNAELEEKDFC